jgi:hypothetical protein
VINGDLLFMPGARVEGDVLVVGGVVDGERNAHVSGTVTRNPIPLSHRLEGDRLVLDEEGRVGAFVRNVRRTTSRIRLTAGGYNRVEGLPVIAGPVYRRRTDWGTVRAEALGILRSANEFEWSSANVGHDARLEVRVGDRRGFALGGRLYDVVDGVETWHLKGSEVALASFFFHRQAVARPICLLQQVHQPGPDDRAVPPASEDGADIHPRRMALEEIDPLADRLEHSEFDAVVHQLGEVTRPRRARVHVSAGNRKRPQDRCNPGDRIRLAARHETGTASGAFDTTRGADIHQVDPPRA